MFAGLPLPLLFTGFSRVGYLVFGLLQRAASVALGTLCLVCFRDVYRLQSRWVPCVWSASEMFTGFSRVGYLVFWVAIEDSIPWFQMGAHNGVDPPRTLSTGLQSASRAGEEAFHGPSHFNELGLAFGYVLGRSSALPTSMLACASVSSVSAHSRFVTYQYS